MGGNWFTVEAIDEATYGISEDNHWEKVHSYLVLGSKKACLVDTGLGIGNIREVIAEITDLPIEVITTHVHWDHIGGHHLFDRIAVHKNEEAWLRKGNPLPLDKVKENLLKGVDKDKLPPNFNPDNYRLFTGEPTHILVDNEVIDLGERKLRVIHTPGHSPGHNELGVDKSFLQEVRKALEELKNNNLLQHGSGLHEYASFKIKL